MNIKQQITSRAEAKELADTLKSELDKRQAAAKTELDLLMQTEKDRLAITQAANRAYLAQAQELLETLQTSDMLRFTTPDTLVSHGGTVKSLGDDTFELCMYKFTNAERRDLTDEYFDDHTDFVETDYPFTCKLLYHHGLSDDIEIHPIGEIISAERRPGDGIYGKGVINFAPRYKQYIKTLNQPDAWKAEQEALADDYQKLLKELMQRGKLAGSGGALPQSFVVGEDGHIKRWAAIEYSLTPSPAEPQYTKITSVKSLPAVSLRGLLDSAGESGDVDTHSQETQSNLSGANTMDLEQ